MEVVLKMLFDVMFFVIKIIGVLLLPFFLMLIIFTVYYYIKGLRFPKRKFKSLYKKRNIFIRLFFDFPKQFIFDRLNSDPDAFPLSGVHLFAGEQGSGKSIAVVEFLLRYKKLYPGIKIRSNIDLVFQDGKINNWQDLVFSNNGTLGQVEFIDEMQNWFNSGDSKNFPPEMLQEITQQRKQRKCIVGTSQVFTRVAKPIREQVFLLYKPLTIFGCFTIVRVYKAQIDDTGNVKKECFRRAYFFIHSDEIRNAYDTYQKVERLAKNGFVPRSEQLRNNDFFANLND